MKQWYFFESDSLKGEFSIILPNDSRAKHLAFSFYTMESANYVFVETVGNYGVRVFRPELSFGVKPISEEVKL